MCVPSLSSLWCLALRRRFLFEFRSGRTFDVRVGWHEIYKFIPCQVHIYNKMYNASKFAMFYARVVSFGFGFVFISGSLLLLLGLLSSVEALQLLFAVAVAVVISCMNSWQCTRSANAVAGTRPHRKRNARRTTIKQIMAFSSLCSAVIRGEFNSNFAIYATFNRLLNFLHRLKRTYECGCGSLHTLCCTTR